MTTKPLAVRMPRPELFPGQSVHVNARAAWLPATVVSVAHRGVGISLATGAASALTRTVAPWVVRPAAGYRLALVRDLRHGDKVVAADGGIHTVARTPWPASDGWWLLTYDNGERAALPAGAVLRLADDTPTVTVNGIELEHPASQRHHPAGARGQAAPTDATQADPTARGTSARPTDTATHFLSSPTSHGHKEAQQ